MSSSSSPSLLGFAPSAPPKSPTSLDVTVTSSKASQYFGLYRKYLFHRDYILEHCSPGLVPVWREILTMMKVVVHLYENRGTVQVFLIKDINAFLLDNETMPLDRDFSSPTPSTPSPSSSSSSPDPSLAYNIRASKSFNVLSMSIRSTFRSRSASSPAFPPEEFSPGSPSFSTSSPSLSPSPSSSAASSLSSLFARPASPSPLSSSPVPSSDPEQPGPSSSTASHPIHQRSNSGNSLISKIFKSRSFDFKSTGPETRHVEQRIEDAIAESLDEDNPEADGSECTETDRLSPLPPQSSSSFRWRRSVSMSGQPPPPEAVAAPPSPTLSAHTPQSPSPLAVSPVGRSESPTPRARRSSSNKFSPTQGMKRSPSGASSISLSFSPPQSKSFMDLFGVLRDEEPDRGDSDDTFSIFGSRSKDREREKDVEKDLAREQLVRSSYRYHMRRRAVCLFHNEDMNAEDPPRPSRSS